MLDNAFVVKDMCFRVLLIFIFIRRGYLIFFITVLGFLLDPNFSPNTSLRVYKRYKVFDFSRQQYSIKPCRADSRFSSKIQEIPDAAVCPRGLYILRDVWSLKVFLLKILSTFLTILIFGTHKINTVS